MSDRPNDQKETLSSTRKPDFSYINPHFITYAARAHEYGNAKGYRRANYLCPAGDGPRDEFLRGKQYLAAMLRHVTKIVHSMEMYQAKDPELEDLDGMRQAMYCEDTDQDLSGTVGPSFLPHICGAAASINMLIAQWVEHGMLPVDPGHPWEVRAAQPVERVGWVLRESPEVVFGLALRANLLITPEQVQETYQVLPSELRIFGDRAEVPAMFEGKARLFKCYYEEVEA